MPRYAVTVYETRAYTLEIRASDPDTARVNAVSALEVLGPFEPDTISIEHENCEVENMDERLCHAGD